MSAKDISSFDFICIIGKGTYGVVYKAKDIKENNLVAIKKIIHLNSASYGISKNILREITVLQKIKHKNIVELKHVFYGKDLDLQLRKENLENCSLYLVFEYCEEDLLSYIQKYCLSMKEIKYIMFELLLGTCYLHSHNFLHRDIKPENIFINLKGEVKLGDLSLAVERTKNMTPTVVTLWYRPPEILLGHKNYDHKVDMWSLGCLFMQLMSGRPLFPGKKR
uniref:Protein kinase domain-containing protein n=1 Tax=Piliocolobus tephrosceles TaxID=591936 RepID=A0A8C9H5P7_9PRIM